MRDTGSISDASRSTTSTRHAPSVGNAPPSHPSPRLSERDILADLTIRPGSGGQNRTQHIGNRDQLMQSIVDEYGAIRTNHDLPVTRWANNRSDTVSYRINYGGNASHTQSKRPAA